MKIQGKNYNSIDLCKIFMAVCVIAMHTKPLHNSSNNIILSIYDSAVNCAVPFFFLASGYLLSIKLKKPFASEKNIKIIYKYLLKIVKMYVVWTIIYSPMALWYYRQLGHSFIKGIIFYLRGVLLIGENYNSYILWYLLSTIYALIFVLILMKMSFSLEDIVKIGCVIILLGYGLDALVEYQGNIPAILGLFRTIVEKTIANGRILRGAFYIPCGMLLAQRKQRIKGAGLYLLITFVGNCFISNMFVSNILVMVCTINFFDIVVRIEIKDAKVFTSVRELSTIIYLIHLYVWTIYYSVVYGKSMYGPDSFVMTVLLSFTIGGLYIGMKNKIQTKCMQK